MLQPLTVVQNPRRWAAVRDLGNKGDIVTVRLTLVQMSIGLSRLFVVTVD